MNEEAERLRELVHVLIRPSVLLVNAYAAGEDSNAVKWEDVDTAHESACEALEENFDFQRCGVCNQYFIPDVTSCRCEI